MTERRALQVQWKNAAWSRRPHACTLSGHHCALCATGVLGTSGVSYNAILAALCPFPTSPLFTTKACGMMMQMGVRYSVVRIMQRHCVFMLEHSRDLLPDFFYDEAVKNAMRLQERLWLLSVMCNDVNSTTTTTTTMCWPTELLQTISCLVVEMTWITLLDAQEIPPFDPTVSYLWYDQVPAWYSDGIDIDCDDARNGVDNNNNNNPSYKAVLASHDYIDLKRKRSTEATTALLMDVDIDITELVVEPDDPNPAPQKKQKIRM